MSEQPLVERQAWPTSLAKVAASIFVCTAAGLACCSQLPVQVANTEHHLKADVVLKNRHTLASAMSEKNEQKPTITILGDSISSGCCCEADGGVHRGFAQKIEDTLRSKYNVFVHSGSGRTAMSQDHKCNPLWRHDQDGGQKTFEDHPSVWQDNALSDIEHENPDVVLVMLGTNDAYTNWDVCANKFEQDYTRLVSLYQAMPVPPRIRLLLPPIEYECGQVGSKCELDNHKCIIKCLIPSVITRIAKNLNLSEPMDLAPSMSLGEMQDIHPNCDGHASIYKTLQSKLFDNDSTKQDHAHKQAANKKSPTPQATHLASQTNKLPARNGDDNHKQIEEELTRDMKITEDECAKGTFFSTFCFVLFCNDAAPDRIVIVELMSVSKMLHYVAL
eukprot:SAG11_NODE_727_length_7511_cov_6.485159_3_plen_389_part_00